MDINSKLTDLWDRIDHAVELNPAHRKNAILEAILELELLRANSTENRILYAIGYAWYMHPERVSRPEIQKNTERILGEVLKQDPGFAHAALYLGHHYYDLGKLELARQFFQRTATASLPPYLRIQLTEILLCCVIRIDGFSRSMREVEKFVREAENCPREYLVLKNLGNAVTEALKEQKLTDSVKHQLSMSFKRLDSAARFKGHLAELL